MTAARGRSAAWTFAWLALLVAAALVMLALQLGSWRSELVDPARKPARTALGHEPPAESSERLPVFGEFVSVDELPEPIEKVPPKYPQTPQWAGVGGTVIVHALIGRDGLVKETKVVHSIPGLDEAAVTAIAQWKFKPAKSNGEPVAV